MANGQKSNLLIILVILLVILNILVLGALGFWFYQEKISKKLEPSPTPQASPQILPSMEPSLQPSLAPSLVPSSTPQPSPSIQTKSDLELIREVFAQKYGKPVGDVEVNIGKQSGPYASGGVRFAGEMGGAMWLAYKGAEGWIIVHDGQGTIPCEATDPYNFPVDMIPECYRESDGTIVKRS